MEEGLKEKIGTGKGRIGIAGEKTGTRTQIRDRGLKEMGNITGGRRRWWIGEQGKGEQNDGRT